MFYKTRPVLYVYENVQFNAKKKIDVSKFRISGDLLTLL